MMNNTNNNNNSSPNRLRLLLLFLLLGLLSQNRVISALIYDKLPKRLPNKKRKRDHLTDKLAEFSDEEFKSQTGLSRRLFSYVLSLIHDDIRVNHIMAERSSGSHLSSIMRLFIHQRLLKGMKAQDADWMGADPRHVWQDVWRPVATAINEKLDNIHFKATDRNWLEEQSLQWDLVHERKYGFPFTHGIIAAGDGLIIKIKTLPNKVLDRLKLALPRFYNRKGYYGLNAQGFCDAWCRFVSFEMEHPGSTNDITAYKQSHTKMHMEQYVPEQYFLALDEAYKSIRDGQHITPFSLADIDEATRAGNLHTAKTMRTFNKILCSDRIAIERAFGQLVRRWPAMWLALPFDNIEDINLMINVAVKLHNLCVDEFLCENFGFLTEAGETGTGYPTPRMPTNVSQLHAVREGHIFEPPLPNACPEVPELSVESLLSARERDGLNGRPALRGDDGVTVDPDIPRAEYTNDPTVNAGIAVTNWLDRGDPLPLADVRRANRGFIELGSARERVLNDIRTRGDLTSAKKLEICFKIQERGLEYVGEV